MLELALLIDVGSTWTKGVAVALPEGRLAWRCQLPTTLAEGIMHGAQAVIDELQRNVPEGCTLAFRGATSSAAGGLRVASIGLVPDLTGLAAKQACLGAGARVVFTGAYALADDEIAALRAARPDIILLTGGTDGGNSEVITGNAKTLARANAEAPLSVTVVLAGNKSARAACEAILKAGGLEVVAAHNVLPTIDELKVESAQAAIRDVFLERIVHARGIDQLREWATGGLAPTPRAVLEAAAFLADGAPAFGTTVVVDIGGATTDVHSIGGEMPPPDAVLRGLPEPRVKRTVEGDLGLRVSAAAATDALGAEALSNALGTSAAQVIAEAQRRVDAPDTLHEQDRFDRELAIAAVAEALSRHAGRLEQTPLARDVWFQVGKDLREAHVVIASGGVFAARADAGELLAQALSRARRQGGLVPGDAAKRLIDRDYVLFAVGLMAKAWPEAAGNLARASLRTP
ncbi:MAG: hypothetical protein FJY55_01200 [Betaproteobacteria bacterium]|nr:hypothetical protein [Betaproteobacteria bacterium]